MFTSKKKYKAKIFFKQQPRYFRYLSFSLGTILFLSLKLLEHLLQQRLFPNFIVPLYIYYSIFAFTLMSILTSWYFSTYSFSKVKRTKYILKKIILENGFYFAFKNEIFVRSSLIVLFYWEKQDLFLEVYPNGGSYSNKIDDLTKNFETAFNMTVLSVQNDSSNHTTYHLTKASSLVIDTTDYWRN